MMKRILAASAALASAAALASPAIAAAPTPGTGAAQNVHITINGAADALCSIKNSGDLFANMTTKLQNADGTINTGAVSALSFDLGEIWCNGSTSSVLVAATPIQWGGTAGKPPAFDATQFTSRIDYTVGDSAGLLPSDDTSGKADAQATKTLGIFDDNDVVLTLTADQNQNLKLVAGAYQGVVTVSITPGV